MNCDHRVLEACRPVWMDLMEEVGNQRGKCLTIEITGAGGRGGKCQAGGEWMGKSRAGRGGGGGEKSGGK